MTSIREGREVVAHRSIGEAADLPDFFIVGAPKCGTTTLYDWLKGHEGVFVPGKELCFFSQDIYPTDNLISHISDLDAYRLLFSTPDARGKALGDATPKYLHSDKALLEIRKLCDRPRIVVCLRDPVDLAISLHSQKVREGWELQSDFARAWFRELNLTTPEAARRRFGETNYVFWAHLGTRLQRLFVHFEREDVMIVQLRELGNNPGEVYKRLLRFLNLPDDGREQFPSSNPRMGLVNPAVNRWALRARRVTNPILRHLHRGRGLGLLKTLNRFNTVKNPYASNVSDELRKEMYLFLAEDIALAEQYLDGRTFCNEATSD